MKHTKGKWYYHTRPNHIAITAKDSPGNPKWDIGRTWDIDHARLIAAAPELLAACESFVFLEKTNMTKKQVRLRIEIAKDIIAKIKEE